MTQNSMVKEKKGFRVQERGVLNSLDPDLIDFFGNPYESRLPELSESPSASIRAVQQLVARIARTKRAGWLTVSVSTDTPQTRHILYSDRRSNESMIDAGSAQSREFYLRRRQISRHHGRLHHQTPAACRRIPRTAPIVRPRILESFSRSSDQSKKVLLKNPARRTTLFLRYSISIGSSSPTGGGIASGLDRTLD
jgi:hypothetical protein